MPFGLRNAPATFSRLVCKLMRECESFSLIYLDDVLIFGLIMLSICVWLLNVFALLVWLYNAAKCEFAAAELDYLGHHHHIGLGQVSPREHKVQVLIDFPRPTNRKGVQRFLELAGLCVLLCCAIGGQLWWAKAFFWQPAMIMCYLCVCCYAYLFGRIKFLLLQDIFEGSYLTILSPRKTVNLCGPRPVKKHFLTLRPTLQPPNYDLPFWWQLMRQMWLLERVYFKMWMALRKIWLCKPMSLNRKYSVVLYYSLTSPHKCCNISFFMVPFHYRRRWRPCYARALCPLKPWWVVLGSHYPSNMYSSYPDTLVFDAPRSRLLYCSSHH